MNKFHSLLEKNKAIFLIFLTLQLVAVVLTLHDYVIISNLFFIIIFIYSIYIGYVETLKKILFKGIIILVASGTAILFIPLLYNLYNSCQKNNFNIFWDDSNFTISFGLLLTGMYYIQIIIVFVLGTMIGIITPKLYSLFRRKNL